MTAKSLHYIRSTYNQNFSIKQQFSMRILWLVLLVSFSTVCFAQQELGNLFLRTNGLSNLLNPATVPQHRLQVGATGYYNLSNTSFTYNDLLNKENGVATYDFDRVIENLKPDNFLQANFDLIPLNLQYKLGDAFLNFHYGIKNSGFANYGDILPDLLWNGNAKYIGQEIRVNPNAQGMRYHEIGLGGGMDFGKISIGASLKYLNGVFDVSTADNNDIYLYTQDDAYQIMASTDFQVNTSNLPEVRYDSIHDGFVETANLGYQFSANSGLGFDVGINAKPTDKLTLTASVIDIGFINWKSNNYNYHHNHTFEWEGIDISSYVGEDSIDFSNVVDSIDTDYSFVTSSNSYKTSLPTKFYLSAQYELPQEITVGGLFYSEFNRGTTLPAVAVNVSKQLGKYFRLGLTYAWRNRSWSNLGANLEVEVGPAQLFFLSDNLFAMFNPWNSKNSNGRIGLSFSLLKEKNTGDELPILIEE